MLMNTIYKITNDFNNKVYIGKTSRPLEIRFHEHEMNTSGCNSYIHNSIKEHGSSHYKIEAVEENIPDDIVNERERYWIQYYNSYKEGYNLTPGGEGKTLPDDIIEKIKKLYQEGKTCREISEELNISHSTIYHRLTQYPWFDKKENYQRSINHFCKPIDQYDEQKQYIQSFNSINEASRQLEIDAKQLSAGVLNHYKVKGFYFCEKGQPLKIKSNKKIVGQFNKDTLELINIYNGAREASRQIGVNSSGLIRACNSNDKKTCKGFIWRYL